MVVEDVIDFIYYLIAYLKVLSNSKYQTRSLNFANKIIPFYCSERVQYREPDRI